MIQIAAGFGWRDIGVVPVTAGPGEHARVPRIRPDPTYRHDRRYSYRVIARNTVGYGGAYPVVNADSTSSTIAVNPPRPRPAAPTLLTATLQAGPRVRLQWRTTPPTRQASSSSVRPPWAGRRPDRGRTGPEQYGQPDVQRHDDRDRDAVLVPRRCREPVRRGHHPLRLLQHRHERRVPQPFPRHRPTWPQPTARTRATSAPSPSRGRTTPPTRPGSRSSGHGCGLHDRSQEHHRGRPTRRRPP